MRNKKIVNVGIIGAGYIAQQCHIPAYLSNPHSKIVGVADINEERLNEVRKRFNLQKTYLDYVELLEQNIDAVSICVPTKYHSKIAIEAASRGIHILCEKPIALTLEEADAMINSCKKNNVKLMIGFNYRFIKNHQEAKRLIEEGRIGKPFFIHGQFASQGPYENFEERRNSFYFDPRGGGGVLFDSGSHLFDLMRWFFGEVKTIYSCRGTYTEGVEVDDVAAVSLEFQNGCIGVITCMWTQIESWSAMRNEGFIKIIGSEGKVISSLFGPSLKYFSKRSKICRIRGEIEIVPKGLDPKNPQDALQKSWRDEINAFIDAVRLNRGVPITGEDGKRALELVLKAYRLGGK
ncbi:MAG: Gfo/Idh/MocA family oxidoreductase [Candidatus Bathyarchaeia archaeon]